MGSRSMQFGQNDIPKRLASMALPLVMAILTPWPHPDHRSTNGEDAHP